MKKALISVATVIVVFLLIVIIGAKLTSSGIENKINNTVIAFNKSVTELSQRLGETEPPIILQVAEFKHHWFSSDVTFKLNSGDNNSIKDFDFTVEHGPFPLSRLAALKLKPVAFTAKAKPIDIPLVLGSTTLNFTTTVDYSNNHFSILDLAPINLGIPDLVKFNTSPIKFTLQCYVKTADCTSNFDLDKMHAEVNDTYNNTEYSLEKLHFTLNSKKIPGFDYLTSLDINSNLKNYKVSLNGKEMATYNDSKSALTLKTTDKGIELISNNLIKAVTIFNIDLGSYDANLRLTNIDAQLLNSILGKSFNQQFGEIDPLYDQLLAKKPVFKIDNITIKNKDITTLNLSNELVFSTNKDRHYLDKGSLAVALSKKQLMSIVEQMFDIIGTMAKEPDIEQSKKAVLDNIDIGVKFLVDKGVLQQKDDEISLTGSFKDNLIKLNALTFNSWDEVDQFFEQLAQEPPEFKEVNLFVDEDEGDEEYEDDDDDDEEETVEEAPAANDVDDSAKPMAG